MAIKETFRHAHGQSYLSLKTFVLSRAADGGPTDLDARPLLADLARSPGSQAS